MTDDDALISTFGRLVEAHSNLGRQLGRSLEEATEVPHAWFEVLLRISRTGDRQMSMGALAQQVALTSGGITKLVDRMVDAGLLTRVPCASDRRIYFAAMTPAGEDALRRARAVHVADLRRVFAGFRAAELRTLDALLDRLRTARIG